MRTSFFGKSKIFLQAQELMVEFSNAGFQIFVHVFKYITREKASFERSFFFGMSR